MKKKIKIMFLNNYKYYDYNAPIHIDFMASMNKKYDILEYGVHSGKFKKFHPHKNYRFFLSRACC